MAQIGAICLYKHMIYIMVIFSHWRTSLALRQLSSIYLPVKCKNFYFGCIFFIFSWYYVSFKSTVRVTQNYCPICPSRIRFVTPCMNFGRYILWVHYTVACCHLVRIICTKCVYWIFVWDFFAGSAAQAALVRSQFWV